MVKDDSHCGYIAIKYVPISFALKIPFLMVMIIIPSNYFINDIILCVAAVLTFTKVEDLFAGDRFQ